MGVRSIVHGPIVYRLGHKLFKLGSRVRLPVGSQKNNLGAKYIVWVLYFL